jgi:hypothetical protein
MKLNIVLFILISLNFLQSEIFAQPQLWDIYSTSNQPYINVTVEKYESDSLYIKSMNLSYILYQDSIKFLIKRNESNFGLGFLFGSIIGGIYGGVSSESSNEFFSEIGNGFSIIFGALIGGTLGGVIGLASGADEKYDIEKLDSGGKRKLLNELFY